MRILELKQGELLLGTLIVDDIDQPWFMCNFVATPDFEAIRPLFDAELAIIEGSDDLDVVKWEEAWSPIEALGLQLIPAETGTALGDFLLHIQGDKAWFTYWHGP